MMMSTLVLCACLAGNLPVGVVRTYGALPEDADLFLQRPGDVSIDDRGRLHVLDLVAKTVMVWDADGQFLRTYGKPGQGPGELQIQGNSGGPQGYVHAESDTFYVYDGGARRLNLFNPDFSFRASVNLQIEGGRVEAFWPLGDTRYLIFNSSYFSDTPFQRAALFKGDTLEKELLKVKDQTWHYVTSGGSRRVEIYAYAPQLRMSVDHAAGRLVLGHSEKPAFTVFDFEGKELKTVTMKLLRQDVTPELKEEFDETPLIKNSDFFTAAYPDQRSFYEGLLVLEGDRYLVYLNSPLYHHLEGYLVDGSGTALGRFTYELGEGGALYASRGRLFAATTDEDGEYALLELRVGGDAKKAHPGG